MTDEERAGRELTPHSGDESGSRALTPSGGEAREVERFSAGPRAHMVGLTEERSTQIVRQSASARSVVFLAVLFIAIFIPVYWFYESGIPVIGVVGRMEREALAQAGGELPELAPVAEPGSPENPRVIRLKLTGALRIVDADGAPVEALAVSAGETVRFELDNTAGFAHNFFIGDAALLAADVTRGLPGVPAWSSGARSFDWLVPEGGRLRFACTIPGHYTPMHGDLVIQAASEPEVRR